MRVQQVPRPHSPFDSPGSRTVGGAAGPAWTSQRWMTTFDTLARPPLTSSLQLPSCSHQCNAFLCLRSYRRLPSRQLAMLRLQRITSSKCRASASKVLEGYQYSTASCLAAVCCPARRLSRSGLLGPSSCIRANHCSLPAVLLGTSLCRGNERRCG